MTEPVLQLAQLPPHWHLPDGVVAHADAIDRSLYLWDGHKHIPFKRTYKSFERALQEVDPTCE